MACEQTGHHPFSFQGPIVEYLHHRLYRVIFSPEACLVCVSFDPAVPGTSIDLGHCFPPSQKGWVMSLPDILSQEGTATSSLCQSFMRRPNADYLLQDRRLCPPWVCLYDICALHHSQELHPYCSLSRPRTSPDHRASTVTYMAHGSCNSNQNTTSVACARTSIPRPAGVTRSAWYGPCSGPQRVEAGRHRGSRR
jgi:hypothetical protein